MDSLVTIKTATYPHELLVIKSKLESDGIECFIIDENILQLNPLYSNMIGGAKLKVREIDFNAAVEILNISGYHQEEVAPNFIWKLIHKINHYFRKKLKI